MNSLYNSIFFQNLFDVHSTSKNKTLKTELHYLCGRSLLGSGKFRHAAEEFSKVISAQPDNTWVSTIYSNI